MIDVDDFPTDAAEAAVPLVSYERRGKDFKWRPPQLFENAVAVTGGFSGTSPLLAHCIYYRKGNRTCTFVELEKMPVGFCMVLEGHRHKKVI